MRKQNYMVRTGRVPWIFMVLVIGSMLAGCSPRTKYERTLARELASGVRHDSLFMGIYLGMSDKDFYTHCWELNHEGLIKQGATNTSVEYQIKDELEHPATMNFYPVFEDGRIVEMTVRFSYNGWAPWNKELCPENLAIDIRHWYEQLYGKGFITVEHSEHGKAFVKVDGNRRITIFNEPDLSAWAIFTDMTAERQMKDTLSGAPGLP